MLAALGKTGLVITLLAVALATAGCRRGASSCAGDCRCRACQRAHDCTAAYGCLASRSNRHASRHLYAPATGLDVDQHRDSRPSSGREACASIANEDVDTVGTAS